MGRASYLLGFSSAMAEGVGGRILDERAREWATRIDIKVLVRLYVMLSRPAVIGAS